ncbi:TetR/AcrR family transcriptional regulator C-terminal domain-containing protein [Streptosporangium lutulentum]|uniref:Tetracycline repressor TetR C-terminal domain-containing protein n=1 Tax=Streptosporangium lutulentum TaxID=1461250 RepID=A0ABT9Q233_9ACTN|nr:TetR/AcrR family transcriptional regulator C-terminal domain-containing protein [Streptosporangium lutulentum]MDP9840792.1 hypothetical protein [Streptosporangium lutulentum]
MARGAGPGLIARQSWALYHRHSRLLQVSQARPVLGPNALKGMEEGLRVVDGIGLNEGEMMAMLTPIDGYVVGTARTVAEASQAAQRTGISDEQSWEAQAPFLDRILADDHYATLARVTQAGVFSGVDDGFDFGLQRVLDGIETFIRSRSA